MKRTVVALFVLAATLMAVHAGFCDPSGLDPVELEEAMVVSVIGTALDNPGELLLGTWEADASGDGVWQSADSNYAGVLPSDDDRILLVRLATECGADGAGACLVAKATIRKPEGWTLDIANSPTCDGYGGDASPTPFASELEFKNRRLGIYGGQLAYDDHNNPSCGEEAQYTYDNFLTQAETVVYIAICDDKILVNGPNGHVLHATEYDADCGDGIIKYGGLFNLDPKDDEVHILYGVPHSHGGDPASVLYMGLNRTVGNPARDGHGLVSLELYALPSPIPGD
ncbi:MAG: hypothetical protein R6U88_04430 [Candidatus Bipolaricaulota bacterium]